MQIFFDTALWPSSKDVWLASEPETYSLLYDLFVVSGVHEHIRFAIKSVPKQEDRFLVFSVSSKGGDTYVNIRILEIWDSIDSIAEHLAVSEEAVYKYLENEGYLINGAPGYSFEETLILPAKLSETQFEQLFLELATIENRFVEFTTKAWDSVLAFCEHERIKSHGKQEKEMSPEVARLLSELGYESDEPLTVSRLIEVLEDIVNERKERNGWCS